VHRQEEEDGAVLEARAHQFRYLDKAAASDGVQVLDLVAGRRGRPSPCARCATARRRGRCARGRATSAVWETVSRGGRWRARGGAQAPG
jgi:hypothetical protein